MVGSERLSQLLCTRSAPAAARSAPSWSRRCAGCTTRSASGRSGRTRSSTTTLGVYAEVDGEPAYDFTVVDAIYDKLLAIGLRPVVELGFMPRDLASDPSKTVFEYGAIISPPKSYDALARPGPRARRSTSSTGTASTRCSAWDFEVWNEANLEVFWSGTKAEWLHLYDVTAAAVKSVDPRLADRRTVVGRGRLGGRPAGACRRERVAGGLRLHAHLRESAARRPGLAGSARVQRRADPVDRVGCDADALQPDQRLGVLRRVPAARDAVGGRSGRRAGVLGRVGPLRGAGPPAAAAARRLRAADRGWAGEAALPRDDVCSAGSGRSSCR